MKLKNLEVKMSKGIFYHLVLQFVLILCWFFILEENESTMSMRLLFCYFSIAFQWIAGVFFYFDNLYKQKFGGENE